MKRRLLALLLFCVSYSASASITTWDEWGNVEKPVVTSQPIHIINYWTVPETELAIMRDGTIRQLPSDQTPGRDRKFGIIFEHGLQVESVVNDPAIGYDLQNADIYQRQWQSPKNGSFLVTQYPYKDIQVTSNTTASVPDWDNPLKEYVVSATSDTLIVVRWIQRGFTPADIDDFTSPPTKLADHVPAFVEPQDVVQSNRVLTVYDAPATSATLVGMVDTGTTGTIKSYGFYDDFDWRLVEWSSVNWTSTPTTSTFSPVRSVSPTLTNYVDRIGP